MAHIVDDALDKLDVMQVPGYQGRQSRCTDRAEPGEDRPGRRFGPIIDFCIADDPPAALALLEDPLEREGKRDPS